MCSPQQRCDLTVIKELLGHAHIGVTATVYAHVRLRLQRQAIDLLSHALHTLPEATTEPDDGDDPPLCAAPCPLTLPSTTAVRYPRGPTGTISGGPLPTYSALSIRISKRHH